MALLANLHCVFQKSHGNLTPNEKKDLGHEMSNKKTSRTNWETFLRAFTSKVPQLLVHVYEKFRNETMDDKPKYYHVQEKNT